ncbi:MAG TPA: HAD-IIIA family hydrolase [Caulobacteraceae bacterium]|nr:HAD-IIIA family hydrolase [Caulobacteraceae bacterium]
MRHLAIIAGGKGMRMGEAFPGLPKALIPVGGKPVLQHQLELARAAGVESVTVFAGHLSDKIAAFVGDGARFGLDIRVIVEETPLGNAGLLAASLDALPEQFFVLYGDVMAAVDLARMGAFHLDRGADFTTLVHPNDHPFDSDLIEADADDRVTAIRACPHPDGQHFANLVNAALYAVRRDALRPFQSAGGKLDFTKDVLAGLVARGAGVLAYRSSEYIKDMGAPARLARVEADWRAGKIRLGPAKPRAAVFLDRDGTLNVDRPFIARAADLELIAGAGAALRRLREAGFLLIVVTNQPVIARGEASWAGLADIHHKLEWELGKAGAFIDALYFCPHHPDAGFPGEVPELKIACDCRKPATGLIDQACRDFAIDRAASWMVGDSTRDVEMARRAGLRSVLVRTGNGGADGRYQVGADHVVLDIADAAELIAEAAMASVA